MPIALIGIHPACYKPGTAAAQPAPTINHGTDFSFMTNDYDDTTVEQANMQIPVPFCENDTVMTHRMTWRAAATSGATRWRHGGDADQNSTTISTADSSLNDTADGTTLFTNTAALSPASNPTADRLMFSLIERTANNVGDTMTGDASYLGAFLGLTSVTNLGIEEIILKPKAFTLPTAGSCSASTFYASPNEVDVISFPSGGGYAECVFTLPRYFTGNLKITTWINPGDTGTTVWQHDLSYVGVGETFDAAWSTGSSFTITGGVNTGAYQDKQRAAVAGAAAGDTVHLRVRRTSGGTSSLAAKLLAIHISYDVGAATGRAFFSPQSMVIPSSNPGTLAAKQDTNSCYNVARFAAGATSNLCNQAQLRNSSMAGGGIMRVRWIADGAGTLQIKMLYATVTTTTGASTNPSAVDRGTVTATNLGPGLLNETSLALTPGTPGTENWLALVKFQRQSGDTISSTVEIVDAWWEYLPK